MGRETNTPKWLEELAKGNNEMSHRIVKEIKASPSYLRTYNAVMDFVPHAVVPKPKNMSVSSLLKLYATKESGRRQEARLLLQQRFEYLDYTVQKKIMWLFLEGSKQDRQFCYDHLNYTWDSAFEAKIIELWETFHEPKCAMLVVWHCNINYVRNNIDELTKSVGYFQLCRRLCAKDKSYYIDPNRLAGPHEYVRVLYEVHRRVGSDEAMLILWRTIENALLQRICKDYVDRIIANDFVDSIRNAKATDSSNETPSPSVVWRPQVMECMRYLYRIAPLSVVTEVVSWDMKVSCLFRCLTNGLHGHRFVGLPKDYQRLMEAMHDMNAFCKLAYAMLPKDKKELLAEDKHHDGEPKSWYGGSENGPNEMSYRRNYADKAVENLLETIKEFRLCESMTPDEWQTFYKDKIGAQHAISTMLMASGELELVCPTRDEFIEKLLY